jgi:hypothetical protein
MGKIIRSAAIALALVSGACGGKAEGVAVSEQQYAAEQKTWPLSVSSGRVGCHGLARWFQGPDGTYYGLNGFANRGSKWAPRGIEYQDLEPIWREDRKMHEEMQAMFPGQAVPMNRISIGDLSEDAAKLCED